MFIAIDGLDGSGKSTAARSLAAHLSRQGMDVILREHPSDGFWGRSARRMLVRRGRVALLLTAVSILMDIASTGRIVRKGGNVVAVRYTLSTCYLGGRLGDAVHKALRTLLPHPDATIVVDLDPREALTRVDSRGEDEEMFENLESMEEVRARMRDADEPVTFVDGDGTPEEVLARILAVLDLPSEA